MSGESLIWIDSISFRDQYANISKGYFPDGSGDWIDLDFTPGYKNAESTSLVGGPPGSGGDALPQSGQRPA